MDFLDPKKTKAYTVRLMIGYVLIAIAVCMAVVVLLYQAGGFGVRQGKVIQNGVVFLSSIPGGATMYLNGQQHGTTNARLVLVAGSYTARLVRDGYRDWQRALTVEGGSVDRFDYPLLVPKTLSVVTNDNFASLPALATQSPDRRWLVVQISAESPTFEVYDLRDPAQLLASKAAATLPAAVLGLSQAGDQSFAVVEWSRDNQHVLLRHNVGDQSEYVMFDRTRPDASFNLTKRLNLAASATVSLQDKKYDRYFIHDTASHALSTATLDNPVPVALLSGVIDYKTYADNVVLYATAGGAEAGRTLIKLYQSGTSYPIRQVAKSDSYLLNVSTYDNQYYVAVGTPSENHVYVYRDPVARLSQDSSLPLVPVENLKLDAPNYIEFSANSQFLLAENGSDLAVFDAGSDPSHNYRSYNYRLDRPVDAPQAHVSWMDGYHLSFVSAGKTTILDYDGSNFQTLTAGNPAFQPFFDTPYQTLHTITVAAPADTAAPTGRTVLTSTPLRTARDR